MKSIWKFELLYGYNAIEMPKGAVIMPGMVHNINGEICIYAIVDTEAEKVTAHFKCLPTGGMVPKDAVHYCGTCIIRAAVGVLDSDLVYHVYLLSQSNAKIFETGNVQLN